MSSPSAPAPGEVSFPRLSARTMRFTLGVPTQWTVSPDGRRVLFLRSRSGTDRAGLLWQLDVGNGVETLLLDPRDVVPTSEENVPAAERARRERMRQGAAGLTAYSTDLAFSRVCVTLSGRPFVLTLADDSVDAVVEVLAAAPVVDPRLSPDGRWVAYHCAGGLHVAPSDASSPGKALVEPDGDQVSWGLSDFVHAEELDRLRSFWWAPDSASLLVARVDESPVQVWYISDPTHPQHEPARVRYPVAGGANPVTELWHVPLEGPRLQVGWDHAAFPYLTGVSWPAGRPALVTTLDRRQQSMQVSAYEAGEGLRPVRRVTDDAWVDVVPGAPAWWGDVVITVERDVAADTFVLRADGVVRTPPGVSVHAVLSVQEESLLLAVSESDREVRLARLGAGGVWTWVTDGHRVAIGREAAATTVVRVDTLESAVPTVTVTSPRGTTSLRVDMVCPPLHPKPLFLARKHADDPRVAVLLPSGEFTQPLPILLDPYGGPHGQRVLDSARAYLESQWWAEQGYAVVVAEGPGTPGSPAWQRAMSGAFAEPALAAQVRALQMVDDQLRERVDAARVAIRGWSFGGYLAALAVLERPDLVHAAVAGAPVTDFALYDTAYTERYLGLPTEDPGRYEEQSLLPRAARLRRPLLLVHGLADDNVVVANTLRLSSALLTAGRAHQVLPLSGVTHMTPQEVVAENVLLAQRDFLAASLAPRG